ncbi:Protein DMR6-LIKE OXYGENASE 1 like [Actinidia chinensis var. chinensis]|uniref:Protein DMR6-LIKE OXYGENASE 1 like n=1 Tax=Actinidia chinensis var. chinensis TaxID=1590841 RepID=A0A2R6Q6A4_ACTCC|nr:Protein DMR6-LIKE OXYGENASE 1 like [Actinidia chinensis var. chinensis]
MAASTQGLVQTSPETNTHVPKRITVKALVESPALTSLPSNYSYTINPDESDASDPDGTLPIIDFSLLTSRDPHQRSTVIQELNKVCQDWGFFMLVNHGVPESLMKAVVDVCKEFFNLPMEEKMEFADKDIWKPIRFGTGVDVKVEKFFTWRDFIKVLGVPQFQFPNKPKGFSEVSGEYCKRTREVARELLQGISEALGLEENYIEKAMDLESGFQLFAANLYPPCPQPELAMGIPAHTDHGLLTFLIENEIGGLQIQHNGKWFHVNPLPNSFLVNTGDHLQVLSNGKYKSIKHRAVVNNKATRISVVVAHGPSLDTVVSPAPELVESESRPAAYMPMKYKDYMNLQLGGKPCLDHIQLTVT